MKHTHNSWEAREGGTYSIKTDLENLATRLEQARPERQGELLREAWRVFCPEWADWSEKQVQFGAMLDCGAYLSAAEMLVPQPGGHWSYNSLSGRTTVTFFPANGDEDTIETRGRATTPSLALAAACVRAAIAGKES